MTITPVDFLNAVAGYTRAGNTSSADRPIRLATVDPAYAPFAGSYPDGVPPCRVTFDGETVLSGKAYAVVNGVVPAPESRVFMLPVGTTYMVAGVLNGQTHQGFYQVPDGSFSGVEFGDGNYWDSSAGLRLDTDADIGGDLTVAGNDMGRGVIASTGSPADVAGVTTPFVLLTILSATIAAGRAYRCVIGGGSSGSSADNWMDARVHQTNAAGTQCAEYYRFPHRVVGQVYPMHGEVWIRRTAGTDLTTDVALVGRVGNGGNVTHHGAAGRPRFFYIEDVGPASKFTWATAV